MVIVAVKTRVHRVISTRSPPTIAEAANTLATLVATTNAERPAVFETGRWPAVGCQQLPLPTTMEVSLEKCTASTNTIEKGAK
jgi:hypothetical protein